MHTALETCGHAPWSHFEEVLRHVDLLQLDLKHIDPERHRELTGQSNDLIVANLERVLSMKLPGDVIIRIPVVPGCSDSPEDVARAAGLVARLGFTQMELVPYHRLGVAKYCPVRDGIPPGRAGSPSMSAAWSDLREIVRQSGLDGDGRQHLMPLRRGRSDSLTCGVFQLTAKWSCGRSGSSNKNKESFTCRRNRKASLIALPPEASVNLIVRAGDSAWLHMNFAFVGQEHGCGITWFPKTMVKLRLVEFTIIP